MAGFPYFLLYAADDEGRVVTGVLAYVIRFGWMRMESMLDSKTGMEMGAEMESMDEGEGGGGERGGSGGVRGEEGSAGMDP